LQKTPRHRVADEFIHQPHFGYRHEWLDGCDLGAYRLQHCFGIAGWATSHLRGGLIGIRQARDAHRTMDVRP
jgi:hypothetical protein